ncbi:MAG TPA: recombinase family protein [Clostridiaceae bacterium]|nr:recombinase family protein [Clostridiaceae bacterium]
MEGHKYEYDLAPSKVGIYVRQSRDEKEENHETIETQRDLLIDYVTREKLGIIYKVYMDDNVSGSEFERRGLKELEEDIVAGNINMLVIKDLSRLGRNNAKTLLFLDFIEEHGVRLITYDGRYDSLRDNDIVGIETWFNERYIRDISRKIRANLRFKIEKGEYIGNAPYGYIKSPHEKNKLCIDEETAHVVKEIFKLYKEGYGYSYIAKLLNSKGYPSPASRNRVYAPGKSPGWNAVAVQRILKNRVYVGDTVQGVSERISFKSKKTRRLPESRWVITQNTHEAIISREEFELIQDLRKSKRMPSKPHKGTLHTLRGLLFCGRCGSIMYARVRKNKPMGYICSNYCKNGKEYCTSHYITESEIVEIISTELETFFNDPDLVEKVEKLYEKSLSDNSENSTRIEKLKQQLQAKQRQQDTLYLDRLEGKISEQLFIRMNQHIERKIMQLRNEIQKLVNEKFDDNNFSEIFSGFRKSIQNGCINNEMARMLIEKITVFDAEDKIADMNIEEAFKSQNAGNNEYGAIVVDFKYKKV